MDNPRSPLELLGVLAHHTVQLSEHLWLSEIYTMEGMLKLHRYGPEGVANVVVMGGGGMGGFLGPGGGLYHRLGMHLAQRDEGAVVVDYRRPSHLEPSMLDMVVGGDFAIQAGARNLITMGHSFGGAVAISAGTAFSGLCKGVMTFATQSAGCEMASMLAPTPLVLYHGTNDQILGPENSQMVAQLAGYGEVRIVEGADHILSEVADQYFDDVTSWVAERFAA